MLETCDSTQNKKWTHTTYLYYVFHSHLWAHEYVLSKTQLSYQNLIQGMWPIWSICLGFTLSNVLLLCSDISINGYCADILISDCIFSLSFLREFEKCWLVDCLLRKKGWWRSLNVKVGKHKNTDTEKIKSKNFWIMKWFHWYSFNHDSY